MHFNWMAYATAVIAQMIIGFIWFLPGVMGKTWADATGRTIEDLKPKNPGMVYGLTIFYTLLITMFLMMNVTGPGQEDIKFHTFQHGLAHALILTFLVILPVLGTPALFEGKNRNWMIVQIGYWTLRLIVAQGILSLWR